MANGSKNQISKSHAGILYSNYTQFTVPYGLSLCQLLNSRSRVFSKGKHSH